MYAMALKLVFPLSVQHWPTFPALFAVTTNAHVLWATMWLPKPINVSVVLQSFSLFPKIPSRMFTYVVCILKPSRLQFGCRDEPAISDFHACRPILVDRYFPSANKSYSDLAGYFMVTNLRLLPTFIPMQSSLNEAVQKMGNLVSSLSKPVFPPSILYDSLFDQNFEENLNVPYSIKINKLCLILQKQCSSKYQK